MTNSYRHFPSLVMSSLLASTLVGCSSAPQDQPVIDSGSNPPDMTAQNNPPLDMTAQNNPPPDMTAQVSPPDMTQGAATKVAIGDPGFGFRLANTSVGDSLYAGIFSVRGIGTSSKLVSISKTTGTVTTLFDDANAVLWPYPQVDPSHLVWLQQASASDMHYVVRVAPLSGVAPSTLFDPAIASGVPAGSAIQDFYDSAADGLVYVVLGTSTAAEIGSVPIGGGAYSKIASLTDANDPYGTPMSVSGSSLDALIRKVGGKLYVGGTVVISSTVRRPLIWQVASSVATPIWSGAPGVFVEAMTDDGTRVAWIEDQSGRISGYDPTTGSSGQFGLGIGETFHAAAANGVFYGATTGGASKRITAYSVTLPSTFDNSALPSVLTTEDFITTDMSNIPLIPTMSLDTDALYFTTDDSIYKAAL